MITDINLIIQFLMISVGEIMVFIVSYVIRSFSRKSIKMIRELNNVFVSYADYLYNSELKII